MSVTKSETLALRISLPAPTAPTDPKVAHRGPVSGEGAAVGMPIGPLAGERTTHAPKREQGIAGLEPNLVELGRGRGHFDVQVPIPAGVEQRKFKIAARLWREVERDSDAADYLWTREVEADDGPPSGQFDRNPFARFESETQIRRGVVCFAFDSFVDLNRARTATESEIRDALDYEPEPVKPPAPVAPVDKQSTEISNAYPAEGVRLPPAKKGKYEKPYMTPDQFQQLIQLISEPYASMIYVAVYTGLRASELVGLRWKNVHADSIKIDERCRLSID